jgi:hypothetical protein
VTTHANHPSDEQLVLFSYGEADGREAVAAHVEACVACQTTLRDLQRTLASIHTHQIPERGDGYGADVWARIQDRLERAPARTWLSWFAPRHLAFAGGIAVLLVAAFLAGRYSLRSPSQQARVTPAPAGTTPQVQVRDRVLLVAVSDHLERSQMVLVEMMNRPTDGQVDITATQEWARDLVPTNRMIRQTAYETGERVVADVLDELERLLVEIANSPSRLSSAEFQQIRQRIEAQGIVFKIRVLDSQMRHRERVAPAHAARSRS